MAGAGQLEARDPAPEGAAAATRSPYKKQANAVHAVPHDRDGVTEFPELRFYVQPVLGAAQMLYVDDVPTFWIRYQQFAQLSGEGWMPAVACLEWCGGKKSPDSICQDARFLERLGYNLDSQALEFFQRIKFRLIFPHRRHSEQILTLGEMFI